MMLIAELDEVVRKSLIRPYGGWQGSGVAGDEFLAVLDRHNHAES